MPVGLHNQIVLGRGLFFFISNLASLWRGFFDCALYFSDLQTSWRARIRRKNRKKPRETMWKHHHRSKSSSSHRTIRLSITPRNGLFYCGTLTKWTSVPITTLLCPLAAHRTSEKSRITSEVALSTWTSRPIRRPTRSPHGWSGFCGWRRPATVEHWIQKSQGAWLSALNVRRDWWRVSRVLERWVSFLSYNCSLALDWGVDWLTGNVFWLFCLPYDMFFYYYFRIFIACCFFFLK